MSDKNNLHIREKGFRIEQKKQPKNKGREGLELNDEGHKIEIKTRLALSDEGDLHRKKNGLKLSDEGDQKKAKEGRELNNEFRTEREKERKKTCIFSVIFLDHF